MKPFIAICCLCLCIWGCDTKNVSVKGKVIDAATSQGLQNMLVTMHQCKTNGTDCDDIVIGQCYTDAGGNFLIDHKTGRKSRTKWITVHNGTKKVGEKDNISVKENNLVIVVVP